MESTQQLQGIYKHYKGNYYEVIGLAKVEADPNQEYLVYRALYNNFQLWLRPKEVFFEEIEYDNKIVKRFELIKPLGDAGYNYIEDQI